MESGLVSQGPWAASIAVGLAFLICEISLAFSRCGSRKTHVAHRRIKIERVYRPYLTATEAGPWDGGTGTELVGHTLI
jgi:hypothetical protein